MPVLAAAEGYAWSIVLLQLGSVLKSMAHVATKDLMEAWGLGHQLWPCWCLGAMLLPGSGCHRAKLLPRVMSRSMVQLQLGSVLKCVAQVATRTHT